MNKLSMEETPEYCTENKINNIKRITFLYASNQNSFLGLICLTANCNPLSKNSYRIFTAEKEILESFHTHLALDLYRMYSVVHLSFTCNPICIRCVTGMQEPLKICSKSDVTFTYLNISTSVHLN